MGKLHKKINKILDECLQDYVDHLDDLPEGRVAGVIVSSTFNRMDHSKRMRKLETILKRELTADEYDSVGAIAALTPAEATVTA